MRELTQFYIDGKWVAPTALRPMQVINPATEEAVATIALGDADDVDRAVTAARRAFGTYGLATREERLALLNRILAAFVRRKGDMAEAISMEMGAPISLAHGGQTQPCVDMLENFIGVLRDYEFEEELDGSLIVKEPIGVVGVITPWNWPLQQVIRKVIAALAAGCTTVMKPSEISPLSAIVFAEVMDEARVPSGVFNLVNGDGAGVGQAICAHPGVDMVTFTGSTRAGILVAKVAADTVKRVHQELGGKSANIIFPDVDLDKVVTRDVQALMRNTGQTCNAPTRMLVPAEHHDRVAEIAGRAANNVSVGDPRSQAIDMGPLASKMQFDKVQRLIQTGIDEGARLVAGGPGRPEGIEIGYFARPTIFAGVNEDMTIAREEIFGPVLAILPYTDEADAIRIANNSVYGLAAYLSTNDPKRARRVGLALRAGNVHINGGRPAPGVPFGGYKQSGNGREKGPHGLAEFLEIKAMIGLDA